MAIKGVGLYWRLIGDSEMRLEAAVTSVRLNEELNKASDNRSKGKRNRVNRSW